VASAARHRFGPIPQAMDCQPAPPFVPPREERAGTTIREANVFSRETDSLRAWDATEKERGASFLFNRFYGNNNRG